MSRRRKRERTEHVVTMEYGNVECKGCYVAAVDWTFQVCGYNLYFKAPYKALHSLDAPWTKRRSSALTAGIGLQHITERTRCDPGSLLSKGMINVNLKITGFEHLVRQPLAM